VGFASVHRIEKGAMSPTVEMLEKLANALDIDVRDLFPPSKRGEPKQRRR
jgi:transcriptional regulator with XRE-family HTH domain